MPLFQIDFEILSKITNIELIGPVKNPDFKAYLNRKFGKASWQYKKGTARILDKETQTMWLAEIHFCESHGKAKCHFRVKYKIERIYE